MHKVPEYPLWLGNEGDLQDIRQVFEQGVEVLVDLAAHEPPRHLPRETIYCHVPLIDGPDNPIWLVQLAVGTVLHLLRSNVPTLLYCGGGMSRSPCIAAAAISLIKGCTVPEALTHLSQSEAMDINPGLLAEVQRIFPAAKSAGNKKG
jgi:protein-tyrosine phosphatase